MSELKAIVEALIFASPEPVTMKTLIKLLDNEPKEEIIAAVEELKREYDRPGGLQMVEVAGGYQIVTRPELHEWVRRLVHERTTQKLSVAARLEAYAPPPAPPFIAAPDEKLMIRPPLPAAIMAFAAARVIRKVPRVLTA